MRSPDVTGTYGAGWKCRMQPTEIRLSSWIVRFDDVGQHGCWAVSCVSLVRGGVKAYPLATHEVQVFPVPPGSDPDIPRWKLIGAPEMVFQFHGMGNDASAAVPHVIVNSAVNGGLAPTMANRKVWNQILSALFLRLGGSRPRFL